MIFGCVYYCISYFLIKCHLFQEKEIETLKSDLEHSRKEMAAQKWLHITDSQVINNFMKKVEDLNTTLAEKENAISCIHSELDDLKQQHQYLTENYEEKVGVF